MSQSKRKTGCIASLSLMLAFTIVSGTAVRPSVTEAATAGFNYAEALQKSIYFYEAQRSGELPHGQPRGMERRLGAAGWC